MSKKLIAVASAAALALAGLVAMPTVATATPGPFNVTVAGAVTNQVSRVGSTAATAVQVNVPSADVLRLSTSTIANASDSTGSVLELTVTTPSATDVITVTATGGVEVLTAAQRAATTAPTTATGTQSLTVNSTTGATVISAYTTSTTAGTVVISAAGSSRTIHIVGLSPVATNQYKLAFTASPTAAISGTIAITGTVRDMFDNLLTPTADTLTTTTLGGSSASATPTEADFAVAAGTSVVSFNVPAPTVASSMAVSVAAVTPASAVTAFPGRVVTSFFTVNAVNLAAQVTALEASVAALNAQLAALTASTVTKAKYNKLVRKWNRANPNNKVKRVS